MVNDFGQSLPGTPAATAPVSGVPFKNRLNIAEFSSPLAAGVQTPVSIFGFRLPELSRPEAAFSAPGLSLFVWTRN